MFALRRFRRGGKKRLGHPLRLTQPRRQLYPTDGPVLLILGPRRTSNIATDDGLHWQRRDASDDDGTVTYLHDLIRRYNVLQASSREMVRHNPRGAREPEI